MYPLGSGADAHFFRGKETNKKLNENPNKKNQKLKKFRVAHGGGGGKGLGPNAHLLRCLFRVINPAMPINNVYEIMNCNRTGKVQYKPPPPTNSPLQDFEEIAALTTASDSFWKRVRRGPRDQNNKHQLRSMKIDYEIEKRNRVKIHIVKKKNALINKHTKK